MIARDPTAAVAQRYDVAVVGGGIYGICVALEAARRGLRPLLLERDDFAGATSWNSLRIVHGGLRYLQTLDLRRFRESVGERSWFLREFPDLVRPIECLMPLYGRGLKRPAVFSAALRINDLLSRRRNAGVRSDRALGAGRVLSPAETVARFPRVNRPGLQGAALWYDAVMTSSQRVVIELLHWACAAGAVALNYVEAGALILRRGRVVGLSALDHASGEALEFEAPAVVNCAGPWSGAVARRLDREVDTLFRPSLGFNLFLDREPLSASALAVSSDGPGARAYFMHPWHGRVLAGTYHAPWAGSLEEIVPPDQNVEHFITELNAAVPGWDLTTGDVLRVHQGLLPAANVGGDTLTSREVIYNHGAHGGPAGFFSVSGVKFTTARLVAERAVRLVARRGLPSSRLPAAAHVLRPEAEPILSGDAFEALAATAPGEAVAYVRGVMTRESVIHLDDLVLRRTDWGMVPVRQAALARSIASLPGLDVAGAAVAPAAGEGAR